ncbi:MAG: substrate-binding domain-containing protein [Clostridia bacterium]|nr:substrate-binding domain-containing protein [Clostridia bacterium]
MNIYVTSEQVGLEGYWITDILAGIGKEALKKNLNVVDYNGQDLEVDGEFARPLVLAVGYSSQWMESTCNKMKNRGIEPLLVNAAQNNDIQALTSAGFVGFGIKKAIYNVLNYLVLARRNRVAFFGGHDETHSDNVKAEEFVTLSRHFGLNVNNSDVYKDISLSDCAKSFEMSMHRYNAVICSSDSAAIFLLKWLEDRNISVPEDIFIIGFGNSAVCEAIKPSITTLESDYVELGRQAVKLHQFLQRNTDISCSSVLVDCPLIERNSTGCLKFKKTLPQLRHELSMPLYDADPDIMMILQTEELLRMWDDIDRSIIKGLLKGKTIVAIAEGLFISVSAVKYRIKKMLTTANLQSKEELVHIISRYNVL